MSIQIDIFKDAAMRVQIVLLVRQLVSVIFKKIGDIKEWRSALKEKKLRSQIARSELVDMSHVQIF